MNWTHFALATLAAGVAASFTEWFFMGVLFHSRYNAYPEVWRKTATETPKIVWCTALGFVAAAAFMTACVTFGIRGYANGLELAGIAWLLAPLPLTVMNALYIKLHPLVAVSQSLGWLVRLAAAGLCAGWLL